MNSEISGQGKRIVRDNELWWWILRLEYLTELEFVPRDPHTLMTVPSSFRPHQRDALLETYNRVLDTRHKTDGTLRYVESLIESEASLEVDDISLIISIYELLWATNRLEGEAAQEWLRRLQRLQRLDSIDGNPLGHLGWRMVTQSHALAGFPRWQMSQEWLRVPENDWILEGLDRATKDISHGWSQWFVGRNDDDRNGDDSQPNVFLEALRCIDQSHPLYYAAVEGTRMTDRVLSWRNERIHYWDELRARQHNDIAAIVSDTEESWVSKESIRKQGDIQERLYRLQRVEMLVERLALRSWQLKGFVSSVASFANLQIQEALAGIEALPRVRSSTNQPEVLAEQGPQSVLQGPDDPTTYLLHNLVLAIYTAPWGWPFRPVSRDVMKSLWEKIEPIVARSATRESVEGAFDILMQYLGEVPKAVVSRHPILVSCHEFLRDEHCEAMWYYTQAVWENSRFGFDPRSEVLRFWTYAVRLSMAGSQIVNQSLQLVRMIFQKPERLTHSEDLLHEVALRVDVSALSTLIQDAIAPIRQLVMPGSNNQDIAADWIGAIAYGVMNRSDRDAVSQVVLQELISVILENETFIRNHPEMRTIADGLRKVEFDAEDDTAMLHEILDHITRVVSEACLVDRHSYHFGHKRYPFQRPMARIGTKEQVSQLIAQIRHLVTATESTEEEIRGVFESARIFIGGVPDDYYGKIVDSVCEYGSVRRLCGTLNPFLRHERPPTDGSWSAFTALAWIIPDLGIEQLEKIGRTLSQRSADDLLAGAADVSEALGAISTSARDTHLRTWAHRTIRRILFGLSSPMVDTETSRLEHVLRCLRYNQYPREFDEIITMFIEWYLEVGSSWRFWQCGRIAYQFGSLRKRLPDHRIIAEASHMFLSDPRASVRFAYEKGRLGEGVI